MFYGIKEVVGTLRAGSHPGERIIATNGDEIEVRGPVARNLPLDTTGHALIFFRLGFAQLSALGDTHIQPGAFWMDRLAMAALAIFAAIAGFYGFQLHWGLSLAAAGIIAWAATDWWHVGQVIQRLQDIESGVASPR